MRGLPRPQTSYVPSDESLTSSHKCSAFCKDCKLFCWNPEKKTVCNRTLKNWVYLLLYYIIFTTLVALLFWALLTYLFFYVKTTHIFTPWLSKATLIQDNYPGLSFYPNIASRSTPLIWFSVRESTSQNLKRAHHYSKAIDEFLNTYRDIKERYFENCSYSTTHVKACVFRLDELGDCGNANFGYDTKQPCVYLKLNKIPFWVPEFYPSNLPDTMHPNLQEYIHNHEEKTLVWVYCDGLTDYDRSHMGSISYYPDRGFPSYYFPFDPYRDYLNPLVAIQFKEIDPGYLITIKCEIWARNIVERSGQNRVTFQIYIDAPYKQTSN